MKVNRNKLRAFRAQQVMTLGELSNESGVALNTIWRLESGYSKSARPSTIRKLAAALGVEPSELVKSG